MNSEIVIVTTYKREELLWICLEAIRREDEQIPIFVFSDRAAESDDLRAATKAFHAGMMIRRNHHFYGNSWNLLDACEAVCETNQFDIVHLIEDDTLIHPGYMKWAREQLGWEYLTDPKEPTYAAVCGRIPSPHIPNWYESPCASWNAKYLKEAIAHVVPEYFSENRDKMQDVLDTVVFPKSKYLKGGAEQDGFFLRCIEHHKWRTCFPPKPLATHLGWFGYNCPPGRERPTGGLVDRVAQCRAMLKDVQKRKEYFGHRITEQEMEGVVL